MQHERAGAQLSTFSWIFLVAPAAACSPSVDLTLEGRTCNSDGQCVAGYECSPDNICVRTGESVLGNDADASAIDTRDGGDGSGTATHGADASRADPPAPPRDNSSGTGPILPPSAAAGQSAAGTNAGAAGSAAAGSGGSVGVGSAGAGAGGGTSGRTGSAGASGSSGSSGSAGASGGGSSAGRGAAGSNAGSGSTAGASAAGSGGAGSAGVGAGTGGAVAGSSAGSGGDCPAAQRCDGRCVDLTQDPQNCGACGNACAAPNGGAVTCRASKCVVTCEAPQTLCNSNCVNVARNVNHCGMCGKRCTENQMCMQSQCVADGMMPSGGLNVPELEKLLARFAVTLEQFTDALGVTPEQLARTNVTLSDIIALGVTLEQLMQAGVTLDDLARIGVDITA